MTDEEFIDTLLAATETDQRRVLLKEHAEFLQITSIYTLKERADQLEQEDARQALRIGQIAEEMAGIISQPEARGVALWVQANAYDFLAENESAVRCYERAADFFNAAGKPLEAARTRIGFMFTLMAGGQFKRAQELAEAARAVFIEHEDLVSQAKIAMNLGNLYFQQGQYPQALQNYQQAAEAFQSLGEPLYAAMNQINQATAMTMLDNFIAAEDLHKQATPIFAAAEMPAMAAAVEHDLAILQYAQGDYAEALRTFEHARGTFAEISNQVNIAQTDLEESDLYLDLNLPEETLRLARQAEEAFSELEMPFELGRAHVNHAVALARLGQRQQALHLLEKTRKLFATQNNATWIAHTDLQRAEILGQEGQPAQARLLADKAAGAYEELGMKTKFSYAQILAANLWADEANWTQAANLLQSAARGLEGMAVPWLQSSLEVCRGRIAEGLGNIEDARQHYQQAAENTELMVSTLTAEEHRTAFVADKLAPYEALVTLFATADPIEAFQWAERAKSRTLVDLLAAGIRPRLQIADKMDAQRAERLQTLRSELNWLYTRLTRGVAPGESGAPAAGAETWAKIQEREKEATSLWRDLQARHAEELSLFRVAPLSPAEIQSQLPAKTVLLEYFIARGQIGAFVIGKDKCLAYPALATVSDLLPLLDQLAFQFAKFQYGPDYYNRHRATLLHSTQELLEQLGQKLLAALWDEAPFWNGVRDAETLIIVPHGPLHAIPFQALRVDGQYLIERQAVSYAPSAAILKYCWDQAPDQGSAAVQGNALLVGVPDESTLHITAEIEALAEILPAPQTLIGSQASFEALRQSAPNCEIIHLAAHGLFRPDAPLLSSIHLGDRWLTVQDVYDLELNAALVALSACETGLGKDAGGDDLMGLVRGFIHAGARALLVSQWTVDDEAMTELVTGFYQKWLAGASKAEALREAQINLLTKYAHPYYWAPLVLIGDEK